MTLPSMNAAHTLARSEPLAAHYLMTSPAPVWPNAKPERAGVLQPKGYSDEEDDYSEEDDYVYVDPQAELRTWVYEEIYRQYTPIVTRRFLGDANTYDITFRWPRSFRYQDRNWDVLAHLHVLPDPNRPGDVRSVPGGIWVEGIYGSGLNINNLQGANYLHDYMRQYIE